MWLELGKQDLLGLNVPAEYGGTGVDDPRFALVLAEELSKLAVAYSSCVGIHADCVAPYLVDLCTRGAEAALAAEVLHRRVDHRDRHDRAVRRLRPGHPQDHRRTGWRRLDRSTAPRPSSPTATPPTWSSSRPGRARRRRPAASRCSSSRPGCRASSAAASSTRSVSPSPTRPSCSSPTCFVPADNVLGEVDAGFVYMMERLVAERIGAAVSNIAHARQILDETIAYVKERHGLRPADRLLPGQQAPAGRAGHPVRGDPGVRRRLRPAAGRQDPQRRRRRQGQVVDRRGAERRCSTPACSSGAGTAT